MFEFKSLDELNLTQLYESLGLTDFTYIETNLFLEQLEQYRNEILKRIKNARHADNDKNLDTGL